MALPPPNDPLFVDYARVFLAEHAALAVELAALDGELAAGDAETRRLGGAARRGWERLGRARALLGRRAAADAQTHIDIMCEPGAARSRELMARAVARGR